jgi:hypothetical protein
VYGATPTLDAAEVLGDSVALYDDIEATALRIGHAAGLSVRDRLRCLHVAMAARERKTALLQDVGLLNRAATSLVIGMPTASQIRNAIEAVELEQHEVVPDTEGPWQPAS